MNDSVPRLFTRQPAPRIAQSTYRKINISFSLRAFNLPMYVLVQYIITENGDIITRNTLLFFPSQSWGPDLSRIEVEGGGDDITHARPKKPYHTLIHAKGLRLSHGRFCSRSGAQHQHSVGQESGYKGGAGYKALEESEKDLGWACMFIFSNSALAIVQSRRESFCWVQVGLSRPIAVGVFLSYPASCLGSLEQRHHFAGPISRAT